MIWTKARWTNALPPVNQVLVALAEGLYIFSAMLIPGITFFFCEKYTTYNPREILQQNPAKNAFFQLRNLRMDIVCCARPFLPKTATVINIYQVELVLTIKLDLPWREPPREPYKLLFYNVD